MIIGVVLLEMMARCNEFFSSLFFFFPSSRGIAAWGFLSPSPSFSVHTSQGTQMCVTPYYLVDENWNKSTVIDVKALFFSHVRAEGRKRERGGSKESEDMGGEIHLMQSQQIRSGTIHKLLDTHFALSLKSAKSLVRADVPCGMIKKSFCGIFSAQKLFFFTEILLRGFIHHNFEVSTSITEVKPEHFSKHFLASGLHL